jgi:hypothetical protein
MSWKINVMRFAMPAFILATGAALAVTGCGEGGSSSATTAVSASSSSTSSSSTAAAGASPSSASAAGGSSNPACTAFASAYKKFLADYVPPESQTGKDENALEALAGEITNITASGQLQSDLAELSIDGNLIATGSTEGGMTTPASAFDVDLQAVGRDCGTTFTSPPASLLNDNVSQL